MDVDYSPTGQEFVTGGYDRSMRIFRVGASLSESGTDPRDLTGRMQRIFCVRYSMNADFVLPASDDGNIRLWKAGATAKLGVVRVPPHPAPYFLISTFNLSILFTSCRFIPSGLHYSPHTQSFIRHLLHLVYLTYH
ncbi:hypothetical protein HK405_003707, partial [Cladochytrium tenue]